MRILGVICAILLLSVSLFGVSKFFFIRTYGTPDGAQYDAKRNLIYISSPQTSQVLAVAADTGQIQRSVYVPNAAGLDITPDGKRLVVGTTAFGGWYGDSFLTFVDLETFTVAERIPITNPLHDDSGQQSLDLPFIRKVVALSNGNILFTAARAGQTGDWIGKYDQTKHTFSLIATGGGSLIPSDDRTMVLVPLMGLSAGLAVFDSASEKVTLSNPQVGGTRIALSHDKKLIAYYRDQQNTQILDASTLQPIRSIVTPTAGFELAFSLDNTKLYIQAFAEPVFYVFDVSTGLLQGAFTMPGDDHDDISLLGMDSRGFLYSSTDRGLTVTDGSSVGSLLVQSQSEGVIFPNVTSPSSGPIIGGTAVTLRNNYTARPTVYFADKIATITSTDSSGIHVISPPGDRGGPVDITVRYDDGYIAYIPEGFSYGPVIEYLDHDGGTTAGGDSVNLYTLGLRSASASGVQVSIGGVPAAIQSVSVLKISPMKSPSYKITLTTPGGTVGDADVVLTTDDGTNTLKGGFHYVSIQSLGGATGVTQMVYDDIRGYLFRADFDNNRVQVVDTATGQVIKQYPTDPAPQGLALSPDHNSLYVTASTGAIDVIDLNTGAQRTIQLTLPSGTKMYRIAVTDKGTLFVGTNNSENALYDSHLIEVDPNTGAFTTTILAFNGPYIEIGMSRDGSRAFISSDLPAGASGSTLYYWDSFTDTFRRQFVDGWADYGVDDNASLFLGGSAIFDSIFSIHNAFETFQFSISDYRVYGEKLDDSGALAIQPFTNSVGVFDVHHGNQLARIALPIEMLVTLDAMAVDSVRGIAYISSVNGLFKVQLSNILSIGRIEPPQGFPAGGQTIIVRGFGFQPHATVSIGGTPAAAAFVNSTTLRVTTPALPLGSAAVQITNDDGRTYTLPGSYSAVDTQPIIAATSPSIMRIGDAFSHPSLNIVGMNFSSDAVLLWNGSPRSTYFVDDTELHVELNASDTISAGAAMLAVRNPDGGVSNIVTIPIKAFPTVTLPESFTFTPQVVNTSSAIQTGTVKNSGTEPVALSFSVAEPFTLTTDCPASIPAGVSCTLSAGFNPVAIGGYSSGIVVSGDISAYIPARGYAGLATPQLRATPSQLQLPSTYWWGQSQANLTLQNLGVQGVTITKISSDSPVFSFSNYSGYSMVAGQINSIAVTFKPTAVGTFTGNLVIEATAGITKVPLTGTAIRGLGFETDKLTISAVKGQTAASKAVATFTNTGGTGITISSVTLSPNSTYLAFSQTNTCGTVLDANASCQFSISYIPTSAAYDSASLMVSVNSVNYGLTLNGAVTDFTLGGSTPTATVSAGQSTTYPISLDKSGGYSGDLSFSCSGAPAYSTCTISPQTVTAGSGATALSVSVTTTARSSASLHSVLTGYFAFVLISLGCLVVIKPARRSSILIVFVMSVLALSSCGGGGSGGGSSSPIVTGTPAGTYTLTVTAATPSGATRKLLLELKVN